MCSARELRSHFLGVPVSVLQVTGLPLPFIHSASDCVVAHGPVTPSTSNWFIHILVNIEIQTVVESTYLKMFVLFNTELGKVLKSVQQDLHSTVKHIIIIVTTHQTNISITLRRKQ